MTTAAAEPAADAIVARLGSGRFAIDLASVAEVGRVPVITRVPGVPAWLAGLANWRGRILPVIDPRPLLGAESVTRTGTARIVVIAVDDATVGLLVDRVEGTTTVGSDVAAVPSGISGPAAGLLRGQVPREDGPLAILDVEALARLREQLPHGRRSA